MSGKNKMRLLSVLIAAVLFLVPARAVFGAGSLDPDQKASLTMTLKSADEEVKVASGVEVSIYLVAEGKYSSSGIDFVLTDEYAASGLDLNGKITQSMIDDLRHYTLEKNISGTSQVSDADGLVKFEGLKSGFYLVMATSLPQGFTSFVPFLYSLPYYSAEAGSWKYDGVAEPKITYVAPVDVSVRKVWNDDGNNRPSSVTIRLDNEDGEYDSVILSDANEWRYTWTSLDATKKWSVKEIDVPSEYKDTYSSQGLNFTVTNTKKLIQTGQLNWPVPVLIFAGAFLISAGIILKTTGKKDEE